MTAHDVLRWWRGPLWLLALATGAKSFIDNPVLGSRRLNSAGLHAARVTLAHRLAWARRKRLSRTIPAEWREQFDRSGYVVIRNFLPPNVFERLRTQILAAELPCREQRQGDTITRRVPIGPGLLEAIPDLGKVTQSPDWKGLLAYAASSRSEPLYYLQTIFGGFAAGSPDPQVQLHSDAFHPALKSWLFLTNVTEGDRPLKYVEGSHLLTPERLAWERARSCTIKESGDRLSQRGSLRISDEELLALNLPRPTVLAVPANTLVVADTFGFHGRSNSVRPTVRAEIWGYCRRSPFLPWAGFDPLSLPGIADRRGEALALILDRLDAWGLRTQHWRKSGRRRLLEPTPSRQCQGEAPACTDPILPGGGAKGEVVCRDYR